MTRATDRSLIVLQSFPTPRPTSNPYIELLRRALEAEPGVEVRTFSWRRALLRRSDVFHAHWPEILVGGATPAKAAVRQLLFAMLLLRLRASGTAVVRTMHNLELPDGLSRVQRGLLRMLERRTDVVIALNDETPVPPGVPVIVVPHGHYRDWYAAVPHELARAGRMAYAGLIRRYKGVEALAAAFSGLDGAERRLEIAGRPSSAELAEALRDAARADGRIELRLQFLSDPELVGVITRAELVVLPYRHMHNSGAVLAALSLDRPVLVPDTPVNARLADEVGPGWVLRYAGDPTTGVLAEALHELAATRASKRPDLDAREWTESARRHVVAYRRAVSRRRGGRRVP